jgi:hypothetical protein
LGFFYDPFLHKEHPKSPFTPPLEGRGRGWGD